MAFPLVVAAVAVFLGALLALGPWEHPAFVRLVRVVAMLAAALVVATHLLPEAFEALGVVAAVGVVAGFLVPLLLEQAGARVAARTGATRNAGARVGLEVSYAGLLVHRFGDGLSMGAAGEATTSPLAGAAVIVAIALHVVPVTTVMVLALETLLGRGQAALRAALLALSTMAGVVVAGLALANAHEHAFPWISAVVAGLLLHVVGHDVPHRHGAVGAHAHTHAPHDAADRHGADGAHEHRVEGHLPGP
ncbi:MAG TPA: hypothetical protein VHE30_02000 [Polyangiaceae bacterium]|nr:hypothetical protein [Polyangiaceae bacterium]